MRAELLTLIPVSLYLLLLVIAAVYDFFQRRIPNWTVVTLVLLFIVCAGLGLTLTTWTSSLAAFGIALVGSVALYLAGWLGAGDSKLFAAAALFAGLGNLLLLVVATALAGGLYALAVLLIRPREVFRGMTARGRKEGRLRGIPYGVAIAAGALVTALLTQNVQAGDHLAHINSGSKPAPAANAK